ncbi:hypothetical protein K432DRAFT_392297 [Lepidopterella palustris CBS 459.81]|uniref:Uncharacterized protein n=1 Tax=Lepidopterella palustris CBS 459.81 TaxID=1314670 RepID=A0A8E2JGA0_9PEZI|nr:hypothetical protein K432DRAFT_392297 [Lepidopterella palustris CBS 459.81]
MFQIFYSLESELKARGSSRPEIDSICTDSPGKPNVIRHSREMRNKAIEMHRNERWSLLPPPAVRLDLDAGMKPESFICERGNPDELYRRSAARIESRTASVEILCLGKADCSTFENSFDAAVVKLEKTSSGQATFDVLAKSKYGALTKRRPRDDIHSNTLPPEEQQKPPKMNPDERRYHPDQIEVWFSDVPWVPRRANYIHEKDITEQFVMDNTELDWIGLEIPSGSSVKYNK